MRIINCSFRDGSRYENFGNRKPDHQPLSTVSQYMNNTDICWLLRPSYTRLNNIYNLQDHKSKTPAKFHLMAEEATKCRHISKQEIKKTTLHETWKFFC